ncbi:MAG TPA: hypothetical protein VH280_06945 [Verrucomicrobiae bacterium]|jgi:hypothetical protein|nr:hypothetical protein [Verrucomicrobiae bacterium]
MKNIIKNNISEPPAVISAPGFGIVHHFTADNVAIESPGSSIAHTRADVEGWLAGMNAARRLSDEEACR